MIALTQLQEQAVVPILPCVPHANILAQGRYFKDLEENALTEETQAQLKQEKQLCGTSLLRKAIKFYDWFTEQSSELIQKLYDFNPYLTSQTLLKLPMIGDKLTDLVKSLEVVRRDKGLVKLNDFGKILKEFLPKREPPPRFERGILLSVAHLESFKKRVLGNTKNSDLIAQRETFYQQVIVALGEITKGKAQKIEHLVEAIRYCGGDPITILPKFKKYTDWEVEMMLTDLHNQLQSSDQRISSLEAKEIELSSPDNLIQNFDATPIDDGEIPPFPDVNAETSPLDETVIEQPENDQNPIVPEPLTTHFNAIAPNPEPLTTHFNAIAPNGSPLPIVLNAAISQYSIEYPEIISSISDLIERAAMIELGSFKLEGIFKGRNGSSTTGVVIVTANGVDKKYSLKFDKIAVQYPESSKNFCNLGELDKQFNLSTQRRKSTSFEVFSKCFN
jgi:hypothetical protein